MSNDGIIAVTVIAAAAVVILLVYLKARWYRWVNLRRIDRMEGVEFERYLAYCFKKQGYRVRMTKASGDFGADLILYGKEGKTAVQAKRYNKPVGVAAVQQVMAARDYYECELAMVVTNTSYTRQAEELAGKSGIKLLDRNDLISLMRREKITLAYDNTEEYQGEPIEIAYYASVWNPNDSLMTEQNVTRVITEALEDHGYRVER